MLEVCAIHISYFFYDKMNANQVASSSLQEEEPSSTSFHAISREGEASSQNLSPKRPNKRKISIFLAAEVDAEEEEDHSSIVDRTREDQAEADAEVVAEQEMDLTSFHASLAEEEVIREDRAETEVDAEVEAGQEEQERIKTSTIAQTFFHDCSRGCATRDDEIEGDRAEVEAGQMSRVDEASELKPPPSVSDRDDTHLCLILDSFTTQLIAWDLNEKDLLLFGQRILSFVEENSDVNSFSEFQSFLLEDDSISRTQLVSTTSSLPNAPPVSDSFDDIRRI